MRESSRERRSRLIREEREQRVRRCCFMIAGAVLVILAVTVAAVGRSGDSGAEILSGTVVEEAVTVTMETETETETETEKLAKAVFEELSDRLNILLEDLSGNWSVYVKDLGSGESLTINNAQMYAASLIKLFTMMSCYESMDTLVANYCTNHHTDEATATATIEDRLYTMITVSRNESYNELMRLHSSSLSFIEGCLAVDAYITAQGYAQTGVYQTLHPSDTTYTTTGGGTNHTTVTDCGELLEAIYNGTCVSAEASEAMLALLLQQEVVNKIPAGIPDEIMVANKTGDTDEESHDVAIVYGEQTDYILCVMSEGVDEMGAGNAGTKITEISELVYDFLNGLDA